MFHKYSGHLALLLTAVLWGGGFCAQRLGMAHLPPAIFNALRNFLGSIALIPVFLVMDHVRGLKVTFPGSDDRKMLLTGGIVCGLVLSAASLLQQWALTIASAGKAGFLTALYIVFVPLIGIFFRKKPSLILWFAVALALFGSWLLCNPSGGALNTGDWLLLACAVVYSLHILVISYFAPKTDCIRMSSLQFFVTGIVSLIVSFFCKDTITMSAVRGAFRALLYCGICSSGIAYTLQIIGQKKVKPTAASLIMSLESVFAAIGGAVVLHERLSLRELAGCVVIFIAVLLAQMPDRPAKKENK